MKFSSSLLLSNLLRVSVVGAIPFWKSASALKPRWGYSGDASNSANASPDGRLFNIDGKVEYFAGTNAWWLGHLSNDTDVDTALQEIADSQYKVVRVWGFGDVNTIPDSTATDPNKVYFHILNSTGSYINYGADGLQRLDYVVSSAETHGVKLVLNFVNNWSDYGGIAAYTAAFGGDATTWYTDSESQTAYRAYIETIVGRYSNSTAIFAWELANEPRCTGCPTSTIYDWANSTSAYIKSLDPSHMVTLGDEGWFATPDNIGDGSYAYSGDVGVDFVLNLGIPTLDYGVFHLYPDSWGYNYTWGSTWILEHDAAGETVGKPVILEEYGTPFPHNHTGTEVPWQMTILQNTSIAADQIWQFGTPDLSVSPDSLGDTNTIYYNDTEYTILGSGHAADMLAKTPVASD